MRTILWCLRHPALLCWWMTPTDRFFLPDGHDERAVQIERSLRAPTHGSERLDSFAFPTEMFSPDIPPWVEKRHGLQCVGVRERLFRSLTKRTRDAGQSEIFGSHLSTRRSGSDMVDVKGRFLTNL